MTVRNLFAGLPVTVLLAVAANGAMAQDELLNLECRSRGADVQEMHVYWVNYRAHTITEVLASPSNARALDRSSMAVYPVTITDQAFTFENSDGTATINRITGINTISLFGVTVQLRCTRGDNPFPPGNP